MTILEMAFAALRIGHASAKELIFKDLKVVRGRGRGRGRKLGCGCGCWFGCWFGCGCGRGSVGGWAHT